ncbi:MAG: hypothetical protein AMXMBFR64_24920 [Myxococcales bacterium]
MRVTLPAVVALLLAACATEEGAVAHQNAADAGAALDAVDAAGEGDADATLAPALDIAPSGDGVVTDSAAPAYDPGGILGAYEALGADGAALWAMTRLDTALDAPWASPWLAAVSGGSFRVTWEGGWLVDVPGVWSLRAISGGGLRVQVDGAQILSHAVPGAVVVEDATVELSAGWHPLSVAWVHDPTLPVLHLLATPPGGLPRALTAAELGYPSTPPITPAGIAGIEVLSVGPFGASLAVSTITPSLIELQVAGAAGAVTASSAPGSWATRTVLGVSLAKELQWEVQATATDLWGRAAGPAPASFDTPGDGTWEPGALLGRYFQGMGFDDLRMERLDPGVIMPDQVDGDAGSSFGAPMEPDQFSVRWEGALHIPEAGEWTLWVGSDDGQRFALDGQVLAEDWRDHGTSWVSATQTLAEGWHPIILEMYENGGAAVARLEWEGPGTPRAPVPPASLGTPPRADDGAIPALSEVTAIPAAPGRALLRWRATELVSATLASTPLGPPATGGSHLLDLAPGPHSLTVQAVDLAGNAAQPVTVTVEVLAPEEAPP